MTLSALSDKEVICTTDGTRLGYIADIEFDAFGGQVCAYLLPATGFWSFSRRPCVRVRREWVEKMGEDLILVCRYERLEKNREKHKKDC
jgi:sporulation protein YlmC with PRC-barrel domain